MKISSKYFQHKKTGFVDQTLTLQKKDENPFLILTCAPLLPGALLWYKKNTVYFWYNYMAVDF